MIPGFDTRANWKSSVWLLCLCYSFQATCIQKFARPLLLEIARNSIPQKKPIYRIYKATYLFSNHIKMYVHITKHPFKNGQMCPCFFKSYYPKYCKYHYWFSCLKRNGLTEEPKPFLFQSPTCGAGTEFKNLTHRGRFRW